MPALRILGNLLSHPLPAASRNDKLCQELFRPRRHSRKSLILFDVR
jgi:hypothetical protein